MTSGDMIKRSSELGVTYDGWHHNFVFLKKNNSSLFTVSLNIMVLLDTLENLFTVKRHTFYYYYIKKLSILKPKAQLYY